MIKMKQITILFVLLIPTFCIGQVVKGYKKHNDKVVITLDKGELHLSPLTENTILQTVAKFTILSLI